MNGHSLNDCLYTGAKFNQIILDVFQRFKVSTFAMTADIERAFLQIGVKEDNRDLLQFLWRDQTGTTSPDPEVC